METVKSTGAPRRRNTKAVLGAAALLVLVVAGAAWLLAGRDGGSSSQTTSELLQSIGPLAAEPKVLSALAANTGHPVYWAGPRDATTYEYVKTSSGNVYIRYLPKGVAVGDSRADWLVVATYPFANAYEALQKVSGGKEVAIRGGGIAVVDAAHPQNVHFAFPGVDYQGEVYDPSPATALDVAASGDLAPLP